MALLALLLGLSGSIAYSLRDFLVKDAGHRRLSHDRGAVREWRSMVAGLRRVLDTMPNE